MTPKEKAKDLVYKFYPKTYQATIKPYYNNDAKQCALICVDEIIKTNPTDGEYVDIKSTLDYWYDVKQEIERE